MTTQFSSTEQLLSVRDIAKICKVHEQTVRGWVATGRLPSLRVAGSIRIAASDLHCVIAPNDHVYVTQ